MKELLEKSRQFVQSVASRVGKAINPPLSSDATPLDIQHAIVEAIESRAQPVGGGRRVLPDAYVKVKVIVRDAADERALQVVLAGLQARVLARLAEVECDVPRGFRVAVAYLRRRPSGWPLEQPMTIEYEADAPAGSGRADREKASPAEHDQPELILTIVRGRAASDAYTLREPLIRIGRSAAPVDDRGHARHNHVAFTEEEDAHSRTVGRGHGEIRYDRARDEYRIFDEGSANGTRVIRAGEVIAVPPRDPFGIAIRAGDELEFGTAAVRVEIGR